MQVAKLFASLGFKVDLTEYNIFEKKLKDVRKETRSYAVSLKTIRTRLDNVSKALDGVNKKLDASKVKSSNQRIAASANRLANAVERSAKGLNEVVSAGHKVHNTISQINQILGKGVNGWRHYNTQLDAARTKLGLINSAVRAIPSTKTVTVTQRTVGGGRGYGGGTGSGGGGGGYGAAEAGGMAILGTGVRDFFRSMSPATAIAGGAVSAGFATKEIVQQGREMKKMEIIMTSATEGVNHFNKSMEFVRTQSHRLGQDVYEMGMGFAKMQQATKGKLNWEDRKTLFTGMAELSTTYGLSGDDQKGIWRALTQMFTKGKIEAEEEGQMAERGLPAKEMIKAATKAAYEKQGKDFNDDIYNKLRQKGGLKMQDIAPELGKIASDIANKNGALDEALKTSLVGQMRMKNAFREASKDLMDSGLDKLLFDLFGILTKLIPVFKEIALVIINAANGFKLFVTFVVDFIKNHPALAAAIAALIVSLRLLRFGIWGVGSASLLMAARFKAAMITMAAAARRFLPFAALYAFYYFGKNYDDYLKGKDNWITTLGLMFELLFVTVDLNLKKIQYAWFKTVKEIKSAPLDFVKDLIMEEIPIVPLARKMKGALDKSRSGYKEAYDNAMRPKGGSGQKVQINTTVPVYVDGEYKGTKTVTQYIDYAAAQAIGGN